MPKVFRVGFPGENAEHCKNMSLLCTKLTTQGPKSAKRAPKNCFALEALCAAEKGSRQGPCSTLLGSSALRKHADFVACAIRILQKRRCSTFLPDYYTKTVPSQHV